MTSTSSSNYKSLCEKMQGKSKKGRKSCKGILCQHDNCGKDLAKLPFPITIAEECMTILETLLKENENSPEQILKLGSKNELLGMAPVCVVAAMGHIEGMRRFLVAGSEINERTSTDGSTPLMLATQNRHGEVVELLLKHGADVTAVNAEGNNSFMIAVRTGDAKLVNLMWAHRGNLDIDHKNMQGCTALHIAADKIWDGCVSFLLCNDADINKINLAGWTPLMLACMKGEMKTVERLVNSGADVLKEDYMGYTAVCWATENHKEEVVALILETLTPKGRECLVKNRIERLRNPMDESDAEELYEDILIPLFERFSKIPQFRHTLCHNKIIEHLAIAIQKHLKNSELVLGASRTCSGLIFDNDHETDADERFVQQFIRSRAPDIFMKAMKMYSDSNKLLNDAMITLFLPFLCMVDTTEGKDWLERNSTKIVTYTGLKEKFELFKYPEDKMRDKAIRIWNRFWEYFEKMLQYQRDIKMNELLEEEERERYRKMKKREKRKQKRQRQQQFKATTKETGSDKEPETREKQDVEEKETKIKNVKDEMELKLEQKTVETKAEEKAIETTLEQKATKEPAIVLSRSGTDEKERRTPNVVRSNSEKSVPIAKEDTHSEQLSTVETKDNSWVTVQGRKIQDKTAKSERIKEDFAKRKPDKIRTTPKKNWDEHKNWADVAKTNKIPTVEVAKNDPRIKLDQTSEKQYDEDFPSLPNSRRSSDIGISSVSLNEDNPPTFECWDDSDGWSSSSVWDNSEADVIPASTHGHVESGDAEDFPPITLKSIANNVFSPQKERSNQKWSSEITAQSKCESQTNKNVWNTVGNGTKVGIISSNPCDVESDNTENFFDKNKCQTSKIISESTFDPNIEYRTILTRAPPVNESKRPMVSKSKEKIEKKEDTTNISLGSVAKQLLRRPENPTLDQFRNSVKSDEPTEDTNFLRKEHAAIANSNTIIRSDDFLFPPEVLKHYKGNEHRNPRSCFNAEAYENQKFETNTDWYNYTNPPQSTVARESSKNSTDTVYPSLARIKTFDEKVQILQKNEKSADFRKENESGWSNSKLYELSTFAFPNSSLSGDDGKSQYGIEISPTARNIPEELSAFQASDTVENVAVVKPIGHELNLDKIKDAVPSTYSLYDSCIDFTGANNSSRDYHGNCPLGESILRNAAKIDTTPDEVWFPSALESPRSADRETPENDQSESESGRNDTRLTFPSIHDCTKPSATEFSYSCHQVELLKYMQLQQYFNKFCQGDLRRSSDYFHDFWYYASAMGFTKEAIEQITGNTSQNPDERLTSFHTDDSTLGPARSNIHDNNFVVNDESPNLETRFSRILVEQNTQSSDVVHANEENSDNLIQQGQKIEVVRPSQRRESRVQNNMDSMHRNTDERSNFFGNFNLLVPKQQNIPVEETPVISSQRSPRSVVSTSSVRDVPIRWSPRSKRWQNKLAEILKLPAHYRKQVGNMLMPWNCEDNFKIPYSDHSVQLGLLMDGSEVAIQKIDMTTRHIDRQFLKDLTSTAMSHYFLVKYKTFAIESGTCYLAMDLHEYTLDEYMQMIQLNYEADSLSVNRLAWQVLKGLSSLHENCGIPHGNIMPSNILVDVEGKIRLSEYGFPRKDSSNRQLIVSECHLSADRQCWTPTEVMTETAEYTIKSDIQVAGMLVYFILTGGRHPFGSSSSLEIQCGIHHNWHHMMYILEEANHLITEMIKMPPEDRPNITELLRHPYFWADEKRLRFVLIVGSDVLRDLKLGVPTSGGTGNTMIDIMNNACCETTFADWISDIDPLIMKEMRSFRQYKNTLVELVLFIYNCCLHFDKLSQVAREIIDEPCHYFLTKFPTLFMCVYRAIKGSARQEKTCYKPFF